MGTPVPFGNTVTLRRCFSSVPGRIFVALALSVMSALPAAAQAQSWPDSAWRVAAGYDTFEFRDVARSKPPVDGSPVRWEGSGPILTIDYERARPFRLHRFSLSVSSDGDFAYETGAGTVPRPSEEGASFLEFQYDYRLYLARELGVRGLHAGVGVRGAGERRALTRLFGGNTLSETDVSGSIAIVPALRYRPGNRLSAELEWANAISFLHGHQQREVDVTLERSDSGGGWVSDLVARGEIRVAAHAAVVISYLRRGEGLLFDLRSYTDGRSRVMAGVTYAR